MRFASLGSGSEGNALLISSSSGNTTVMLDCGFGLKETERRLQRLQCDPTTLGGILVTHEHSDHVGGVFKLARRYQIPVWISYGTLQAVIAQSDGVDIRLCRDNESFTIDELTLQPYTVPHDAREPLQFVASDGVRRLGVLTDVGMPTPHVVAALGLCDALLLECNHDSQMLADSSYPHSLKSRISGPYGHLSNDHASQILDAVDRSRLNKVVGAHLSQQNNTPELARLAIESVVGEEDVEILIACQEQGFDWLACA